YNKANKTSQTQKLSSSHLISKTPASLLITGNKEQFLRIALFYQ
ncbi:MAG: hypothetical protein PWP28_2595, partial [Oceanotoga sp.]|nr:hypothetical protein [Oceanotoga sp.]